LLLRTQLITALQNPKSIQKSKDTFFKKCLEICKVYAVQYFILSFIVTINSYIFPEVETPKNLSLNINLLAYPLFPIILGPIIEELGIRLPLIPSKINIIVGIPLIIMAISDQFNYHLDLIVYISSLTIVTPFILNSNIHRWISRLFKKYFTVFFYVLCTIFAMLHFRNSGAINYYQNYGVLSLLIVVPSFISGLMYSFIRLKYGLIYSIIIHSFWNFCSIVIFPNKILFWIMILINLWFWLLFIFEQEKSPKQS
jgi:Type II CAAX prenyl endopeptidase Rce1-like